MGVPLRWRKPKFDVIIKAGKLHEHTLLVTQGKKFIKPYKALTDSICNRSEQIYLNCYLANEISATTNENIQRRIALEKEAIQCCDYLLALIDLAYSTFHLRGKSVNFWANLIIEERQRISNWINSETRRLR